MMEDAVGNIVVPVDDRLYSTLKIGSAAFPFMLFHDDLDHFAQGFVNWHKQEEIEISYILEGSVRVCLLREEHILHAGEGFIILPGALHSIQPISGKPGRYTTLIFHPSLLSGSPGSFFDQAWYSPVITTSAGYYKLPDNPANSDIREHLFWLHTHADDDSASGRLMIQRRLQDVWILFAGRIFPQSAALPQKEDRRILDMLHYLRTHYSEKFSLTEMAEHIHISRGECCRYFKKMMGMTLTEYLTDYRLSKAAVLLSLTQKNISDIALQTGFCSPSSFSAEFRRKTGCTPSQYRENAKQSS